MTTHLHPPAPLTARDHDTRALGPAVAAGVVLAALLVGAALVVGALVDLASWALAQA